MFHWWLTAQGASNAECWCFLCNSCWTNSCYWLEISCTHCNGISYVSLIVIWLIVIWWWIPIGASDLRLSNVELRYHWIQYFVCALYSYHIDGLVQERCNSSALAMEWRLSALAHRYICWFDKKKCMKWPVAHSPNSTWFWLELVGNCWVT